MLHATIKQKKMNMPVMLHEDSPEPGNSLAGMNNEVNCCLHHSTSIVTALHLALHRLLTDVVIWI
jgi:hypothetical protein